MTGDDIKAVRTRHGWTQKQLADRLGISQVRVSQLETGDRITRVMQLAVLALDRIGPAECEERIHTTNHQPTPQTMPTTFENEALEAYSKAVDHHVDIEYDDAVEDVEHELQEMNTGLSYESIELLAERVAAVATLAALAHVKEGGDAEGMRHMGTGGGYLGGDHASDEVLKALKWMEHEDAILDTLRSAADGWAVEITEAALENRQ